MGVARVVMTIPPLPALAPAARSFTMTTLPITTTPTATLAAALTAKPTITGALPRAVLLVVTAGVAGALLRIRSTSVRLATVTLANIRSAPSVPRLVAVGVVVTVVAVGVSGTFGPVVPVPVLVLGASTTSSGLLDDC
ncbi:hypothetical protein, partial [Streptomyces sp. NPDC059176]|uniref:hypothetical protein n=1 Tax=unclassified Streptomyces TaxID=2593676 RepID=UPI003683BB49